MTDNLAEHNQYLRERLREEQQQTKNLRNELTWWKGVAEKEHQSWFRLHDALNLLRQDTMEVMQGDTYSVYRKLELEREIVAALKAKRKQWGAMARRATEAKAEEAQRARELDAVVEQLRQRLVETERQRDDAVAKAEEVVADQKAKLDRIEEQCRLWKRGQLDTMTTIAGISGEFAGHPLPDFNAFERVKALGDAQTISLMSEAADQLDAIEAALDGEGVNLVTTHVKQVRDYIELMNGRLSAAEEE